MIWPQVSLAQLAAILMPDYTVEVIDANALRMGWPEFEKLLEEKRPKYYLTQVTAPSLRNDMYGVFLAKALGARTSPSARTSRRSRSKPCAPSPRSISSCAASRR